MGHVLLKGKATLMKICLEQEQKNERQLREGWFVKIQSNSLTVLFLLKAKGGGGWMEMDAHRKRGTPGKGGLPQAPWGCEGTLAVPLCQGGTRCLGTPPGHSQRHSQQGRRIG